MPSRKPIREDAFTLIELLVVVTLLGVAAGLATVRLDGVSVNGRLRSAGTQTAALIGLAQAEARLQGTAQLLVYDTAEGRVARSEPARDNDGWAWREASSLDLQRGISLDRVVGTEEELVPDGESGLIPLRVRGDGWCLPHIVVMSLDGRCVLIQVQGGRRPVVRVCEAAPQQANYEDLLRMLEASP